MEEVKITGEGRRRSLKFWGGLILLVAVVGAPYFYRTVREYWQARKVLATLEKYENLVKNDTYGGATPEETLQLFVTALKEGDVLKASLYFTLDDNGGRETTLNVLKQDKEKNNLEDIVKVFSNLELVSDSNNLRRTYEYKDENGGAMLVHLLFTGNIWKIENL